MNHIFAYIGLADLEVIHLLSLLYIVSAAVVSLLSLYYKKVRKVISDSILETPCTDYCDKYFLFIFFIKAVECCAWVVNLKLLADGTEDDEAMSRCVDGGPSATFVNLDA